MERYFHIDNSTDQLLEAVKSDGVPRYTVGDTDTLRKFCALHEAMREGAMLCLASDPSNSWFYVNKSALNTDVEKNILPDVLFMKIKVNISKDELQLLNEVMDVAVFTLVSEMKRTERLVDYMVFGEDTNVDDKAR